MNIIFTAASLGAFLMFFACAPEAATANRLEAVIGCMEQPEISQLAKQKIKLEDEYQLEVSKSYHSLLKQGHGRVQAKKSAEAIWFELGQEAQDAQRAMDAAVKECARKDYNVDL